MTAFDAAKLRSAECDAKVSRRIPKLLNGGALLICLAFTVATSRDALVNLYDRWMYEDEYGYGLLIALLIPLLLWRRRHLLASDLSSSRWPGFAFFIVAQLGILFAALGETYFFEQITFVISIMALGLIVYGNGAMRVILPITVLALLAISLPYTLQAILTIKLQLLSTDFGVAMI